MKRPVDNERFGRRLRRVLEHEFNGRLLGLSMPPFEVWRSRDFLVTLFDEDGHVRVTVNRSHMPNGIDWADGITWDELQAIKHDIGRGELWAVECYPPDDAVINVSNMRHLWLLDEPPAYGWNTHSPATPADNGGTNDGR